MHGVRFIVVTGTSGSITLDAMQWCNDQSIGVLVIDRDGQLTTVVSPPAPPLVELRQLQYNAEPLSIARILVRHKLRESAKVRPLIADVIAGWMRDVERAVDLQALRLIEGHAAAAYWNAWSMELRWREHAPEHWKRFAQRQSPVGSADTARYAVHPVNAMLNYAYAVLVGQLERSIVLRGLDPAMGYLHTPRDHRASLVYDLIEPLRARVDGQLLPWVQSRQWSRSDFAVDRKGVIRLHPQLARVVVEKSALAQTEIDSVVEWLVGTLRGIAIGIQPK